MVRMRALIEAASIFRRSLKLELALLVGDILVRAFTKPTPVDLSFWEWIFLANNCQIALLCLFLFRELVLFVLFVETMLGVKHLKIVGVACLAINFSVVYVSWKALEANLSFSFFAAATGVLIVVLCLAELSQQGTARWRRQSVREDDEEARIGSSNPRQMAGLIKKFRHDELVAATGSFGTPIGRGGSGTVFKGIIDGSPIAVKRIEMERRGDSEFWSEITAIANVQHASIVRLLGYCLAGAYRYIVYEFIENGSLDAWIYPGSSGGENYLTWAQRYQVAIDVAKALAYVHHDCRSRILHLDLKPANILLDDNFRAYISDFGVSRLMGMDESTVSTGDAGTRGYLAPERVIGGWVSVKSDVYSYGMVLLELVGGRKNMRVISYDDGSEIVQSYFPKIVNEKMRDDKLMEVVDGRLWNGEGVDKEELKILVHVALWCIQHQPEDRPSMESVVEMLQRRDDVPMPPETRMFVVEFLSALGVESYDGCSRSPSGATIELPYISINSCTLSTQVGR